MKAYHFLKDDMCGGYGSEPAWRVGEEREIKDGKIRLCERGYHSSPSWYDALGYARGSMACIVEISEPIERDATKFVSRKRKLIEAHDAEFVLREWACACAERALKKTKVKDKRSWDAIRIARLYNKGKATKDELDAARDSARDSAWAAAWAAAKDSACAAAWATAWAAAKAAARDAARATAWDAACDVACDAEVEWQKRRLNTYMDKIFKVKDVK